MGPFPRSIPNHSVNFTVPLYHPDDGFDGYQIVIEALQQAQRVAPLNLLQLAEHLSGASDALFLALGDHLAANAINWRKPDPQPFVLSAAAVGTALGIMTDLLRTAAGEAAQ